MGRRKRRNSDIDLSVEKIFDRRQGARQDDQLLVNSAEQTHEADSSKSGAAESIPAAKKQKTRTEAERIDALKKKKQDRKLRQQEKKDEKQRKSEDARKQDLDAKKLRENEQKAKKIVPEKSKEKPFITIQKGVQYQDVLVGKGPPVQDRKKVRVAYTLRAKHRYGKILDSSNDFGFRLGRGDVIDGWDIGLQGMRQGGKRYLIIPPQAGYGQQNVGAGAGGILFFDVTILVC
jgi:FKBP-type peptidyl-prolyl cis-trans isomerase